MESFWKVWQNENWHLVNVQVSKTVQKMFKCAKQVSRYGLKTVGAGFLLFYNDRIMGELHSQSFHEGLVV